MDVEELEKAIIRSRILEKYKNSQPNDLMYDISERIAALFFKVKNMKEDNPDEYAVIKTFLKWLDEKTETLQFLRNETKKMLRPE